MIPRVITYNDYGTCTHNKLLVRARLLPNINDNGKVLRLEGICRIVATNLPNDWYLSYFARHVFSYI